MNIKRFLLRQKHINYYFKGKQFLQNSHYLNAEKLSAIEIQKTPSRTDIINYLLSLKPDDRYYLEIGVRNPEHNFKHIKAAHKYSVDPGIEFKSNPVDFKMTSDDFFSKLTKNEILSRTMRFDLVFIDGLHLAEQVNRDIENAFKYLKDDGFIVLHDCNPSSEWHAREAFLYKHTPAQDYWNGTTWKAFLKWRSNPNVNSCCIDCDWGVGILSKTHKIGNCINQTNPFFEFHMLDERRKELLNLIDFDDFKNDIEHELNV